MNMTKLIIALLLTATVALAINAQVVKREAGDRKKKGDAGMQITDRQQSFFEVKQASDADLQWMKIIYRSLDLTKGRNPALYYPEEPNADGKNLFYIIIGLLADGQVPAYEYLDGREMFTDEYRVKVSELLDRFHIPFTEAKGSSEKHPKYEIDNSYIPGNEILSYYIIERYEFDTRSNKMKAQVDALCPVLHRTDEWGGEGVKYPMFWVKLNDVRPYLAQQYVFTDDDNNLARYSLDDFFKLNMYEGEIYKTKSMRNQSLMQMYPDEDALRHAQDSIEQRLKRFDKELWVPDREELLAAKAKKEMEEDADGENVDGDNEATEKVEKRTTKRSGKSDKKKSTSKRSKKSEPKVKQRTKSSSGNSGAVRSVRNRRR